MPLVFLHLFTFIDSSPMASGPAPENAPRSEQPDMLDSHSLACALELQLPRGLPLFEPRERLALLVNAYDRVNEADVSSVAWGNSRGSMRICDMEALLSGSIAEHPVLSQQCRQLPAIRSHWEEHCRGLAASFRPELRYEVDRIQGYERDSSEDLTAALENLAARASPQTLIFLYLNAHGAPDGLEMIDGLYPYERLFALLERCPGKKVIGNLACYSGAALEFVPTRSKDDYVVFASSRSTQLSVNWADDRIDQALFRVIRDRQRLSEWQIEVPDIGVEYEALPIIRGAFDVLL